MSGEFLLKVADVLDAAAAVIDVTEVEKTAAASSEREKLVSSLNDRYITVHGSPMPAEMRSKLASADASFLNMATQLIDSPDGELQSMGGSSEKIASAPAPRTRDERAKAAWDSFGSFINS